ncbi:hypothetical protein [Streptomyces venezuelae]|uniref:hypothetical protein n=1 Tax=Streptomyces venezuelae TaxID=54571 RepID=UPI00168CAD3E|nr:hypothetical protein [Streptomyces venezuelae]
MSAALCAPVALCAPAARRARRVCAVPHGPVARRVRAVPSRHPQPRPHAATHSKESRP